MKAAKYTSPQTIMGFADFETKLVSINQEDKIEDAFDKIESFTIRKSAHKIVSFSLIFIDTDGKLIFEKKFLRKKCRRIFFQNFR